MRIAVVGGGVSGLSATWALNEFGGNHRVHLFEAGEYVGGHTNTVQFLKPGEPQQKAMVDTGFIVFNEITYPNFLAFVHYLGLPILASDMSFAMSRTAPRTTSSSEKERGAYEWAGNSLGGLFCQWTNIFNLSHWRMVWDIVRFNCQSVEALRAYDAASEEDKKNIPFAKQTIGSWLQQNGYSHAFSRNYLIPMAACIWSTPADDTFDQFPALTLLRFMYNHHLLQILNQPQWLTLQGGSKCYIDRVLSKLPTDQLHQGGNRGRVVAARRDMSNGSEWVLQTADGEKHVFDRVIFAAHADNTSAILAEELVENGGEDGISLKECLDTFRFNKSTATLHADAELMPVRRKAWSSWNFLAKSQDGQTDEPGVTLTYWMNLLQSLDEKELGPVLVTLNAPAGAIRESKQLSKFAYEHPIYTAASVDAQKRLKTRWGNGWNGAHFAGAWTNYGFHEDGFASGLRAAHNLGAVPPFPIRSAERSMGKSIFTSSLGYLVEWAEKFVRIPVAPFFVYVLRSIILSILALFTSFLNFLSPKISCPRLRLNLHLIQEDWEAHHPSASRKMQ